MSTTRIPEPAWATVAAHVSGHWESRRGARGTLLIKGRELKVRFVTIDPRGVPKPRLRFDRVALRLIETVKMAISPRLPRASCALITCTAPIRLPAKVALDIESAADKALLRRSTKDFTGRLSGNSVRIRLLRKSGSTCKVCTFVHNPETDSEGLVDVAQALLLNAGQSSTRGAATDLLVLCARGGSQDFDAYQAVFQALATSLPEQRMLMVFADGNVRTLG